MKDLEKLKAEIEKKKADVLSRKESCLRKGLGRILYKVTAYNEILSLISELEKEPDINPTLLEKEKIDEGFTRMMKRGQELNLSSGGSGAIGTASPEFKLDVKAEPQELDEAAEEYARPCGFAVGAIREGTILPPNPDKLFAFKAGAKWMEGQYKKLEGELVDWYRGDGREYCHGIECRESFEVPEGFYIKKKTK